MPTRLQIARRDIFKVFEDHDSHVFRQRDIESILSTYRSNWRLAQRTGFPEFVRYLTDRGRLKRMDFPFPQRREIRYTWGEVPLQAVLMTLKPRCHFSHYTAVQMHDLTEQDSKTVYVNFEQPPRPVPPEGLLQGRIAAAFARKPRVTNNVARLGDIRVYLLNGKNTGYLGVESREIVAGESKLTIRVTDIERTLIDIAVRPFYAGGVGEVVKAYQRAGGRASVNRLAALLKQLAFVYPYQQAIGFYLERSGAYTQAAVDMFRGKFALDFDFYLTYEMRETRYDPRWRLFVPKGL